MGENYGVYLGNQLVGKVQVIRQGLYYRFICRCRLTGDVMCRLYVVCDGNKESLGLVVPMEDGFGLDTRIPVKRVGQGEMEFTLLPKHDTPDKFVPIYPEEPFAYIENLKNSFLTIQGGQMGIIL